MAVILLVVANSASLSAGDSGLRTRIENRGHSTFIADDNDPEVSASLYQGVVIAESVSSGTLAAKYAGSPNPGICFENAAWNDWGMCTIESTQTGAQTQWDVQGSSPLTAGLSGTQTVFSSGQSLGSSATTELGADAIIPAVRTTSTGRTPFYAYDTGGAMASGTAPARRIAMSVLDAAFATLTSPGQALVDAAIDWAFTFLPPPGQFPPARNRAANF